MQALGRAANRQQLAAPPGSRCSFSGRTALVAPCRQVGARTGNRRLVVEAVSRDLSSHLCGAGILYAVCMSYGPSSLNCSVSCLTCAGSSGRRLGHHQTWQRASSQSASCTWCARSCSKLGIVPPAACALPWDVTCQLVPCEHLISCAPGLHGRCIGGNGHRFTFCCKADGALPHGAGRRFSCHAGLLSRQLEVIGGGRSRQALLGRRCAAAVALTPHMALPIFAAGHAH